MKKTGSDGFILIIKQKIVNWINHAKEVMQGQISLYGIN